jgi:hypothetical protein
VVSLSDYYRLFVRADFDAVIARALGELRLNGLKKRIGRSGSELFKIFALDPVFDGPSTWFIGRVRYWDFGRKLTTNVRWNSGKFAAPLLK